MSLVSSRLPSLYKMPEKGKEPFNETQWSIVTHESESDGGGSEWVPGYFSQGGFAVPASV